MVPLRAQGAISILDSDDSLRRRVALLHASLYQPTTLWGDHPRRPRSALLLRPGDGSWEIIGVGRPEPALGWLLSRDISVTLLAPEPWHASAARRVGPLKRESVETWVACGEGEAPPRPTTARARRLLADDQAAFLAVAPPWALRGWSSYQVLIDQAIAFGVPHGSEFAALAWVVEQEVGLAALGVFTTPRFRRIGLGRAACLALIRALKQEGGRDPVWFTSAANEPSRALATALGFQLIASEPLSRWPLSNWSSETGRAT